MDSIFIFSLTYITCVSTNLRSSKQESTNVQWQYVWPGSYEATICTTEISGISSGKGGLLFHPAAVHYWTVAGMCYNSLNLCKFNAIQLLKWLEMTGKEVKEHL